MGGKKCSEEFFKYRRAMARLYNSSTSAQESVQDSPTQRSRSLDLASLDCANETNGAKTSSDSDIPTVTSNETLTPSITTDTKDESTSSPPLPPVNPSPSGENGWGQQTKETVSRHSSKRSPKSSPDTSALRTSQDCSTAPTDPDTSTNIFHIYSDNLPSAGTMRNGYVSAQDTLPLPSLDDGYCWLESPTALSATPGRRPPGLSRLENQLKEYGLIEKGQVLRPDFLLSSYNLPKTYLDPSEKRTAIQLHEDNEKQLEIFSTPELQPLPSDESSICPSCQTPLTDEGGCGVCGWSGEKLLGDKQKCSSKNVKDSSVKCSSKDVSPSKKRRGKGEGSGCIYWRTVTRNGKDYQQAYYQWRSNGKQRTRYIPKKLLDQVLACEAQKLPVADILVLLGDKQKCSSKKVEDSSVKCSSKDASPSKKRRGKGEGSGSIHCKPIKRGKKDYPQYWYHYEIWQEGDRLLKKTKYIPKRLLSKVQRLDQHKAPVREILKVLGVI